MSNNLDKELIDSMNEFAKELIANQVDMPSEFSNLIDENFFDLIDEL